MIPDFPHMARFFVRIWALPAAALVAWLVSRVMDLMTFAVLAEAGVIVLAVVLYRVAKSREFNNFDAYQAALTAPVPEVVEAELVEVVEPLALTAAVAE